MRRKWLIERPLAFGALCAASSVLIGVFHSKTLEQQALNVALGLLAGALVSVIVRTLFARSNHDPSQ